MNTQEKWDTTAKVTNPERQVFWQDIFGTNELPIVSIVPQLANLPGFDKPQSVYMLDLKAITTEQRQMLIVAIARKFAIPTNEVSQELDNMGVPILASDLLVSTSDRRVMASIL